MTMNHAMVSAILIVFTGLAAAQCTKDSDCKGSRICVNGVCTDPAAQPQTPPAAAIPAPQQSGAQPLQIDSATSAALNREKAAQLSDSADSVVAPKQVAENTAPGVMHVSVLPLRAERIDSTLLTVLADDFRKALAATGKFSVMSREIMQEILHEQALQLSGICDQDSCLAKTGKIIGVSHMAAVSITAFTGNTYAVSAKLVEVSTGRIVATASESRSGGVYEINTRILTNLASVLAGKPNQDHIEYVNVHEKELQETQRAEAVKQQRIRVSLFGTGFYPVNVLQPDAEARKRAYYETDPHLVLFSLPQKKVDFSLGASGAYRIAKQFWLSAQADYSKTRVRQSTVVTSYRYSQPALMGPDTILVAGPQTMYDDVFMNEDFGDIAIGIDFDLVSNARIKFGFSAQPTVGMVFCHRTEHDSTYEDLTATSTAGAVMGKIQNDVQSVGMGTLSGITVGFSGGCNAEFFLLPRLSICSKVNFSWKTAPSLQGTIHVNQTTISRTSQNSAYTTVDTSYDQSRAAMRGNFLGTGEYVQIQDPDAKQIKPDGTPSGAERSSIEFADFRLTIGLSFYF
jgi:curli biogenesis system outer membrane secretion channel CsgG